MGIKIQSKLEAEYLATQLHDILKSRIPERRYCHMFAYHAKAILEKEGFEVKFMTGYCAIPQYDNIGLLYEFFAPDVDMPKKELAKVGPQPNLDCLWHCYLLVNGYVIDPMFEFGGKPKILKDFKSNGGYYYSHRPNLIPKVMIKVQQVLESLI